MSEPATRPAWVRWVVPRKFTRANYLVRCWSTSVASALLIVWVLLLEKQAHYQWWIFPLILTSDTVWGFLALRWIDRHGTWPSIWSH